MAPKKYTTAKPKGLSKEEWEKKFETWRKVHSVQHDIHSLVVGELRVVVILGEGMVWFVE